MKAERHIKRSFNKKPLFKVLYGFFFLVFVYALLDFQTSRNTGADRNVDRGSVHIALFTIILFLSFYYAITKLRIKVKYRRLSDKNNRLRIKQPFEFFLCSISIWIFIVNLTCHETGSGWIALTHLGISILWFLTFNFNKEFLFRSPNAWSQVQVCIVIMFMFNVISALYSSYVLNNRYKEMVALNLSYNVIVFLPWISLIAKKKIRYLCFFFVFIVIMSSMKRGAIIVFPLMMFASFMIEAVIKKKFPPFIFKSFIGIILFIGSLAIVDQVSDGFLSKRFSHEQLVSGSKRSEMYPILIDDILHRPFLDFFVGNGSRSVLDILGTGAHSEWLEFFSNFGVVGVSLYALMCFYLVFRLFQLTIRSSPFAPAYSMVVVYILVVGMFGMIYFTHTTLYIIAFLGAVEGLTLANKKFINVNKTAVI